LILSSSPPSHHQSGLFGGQIELPTGLIHQPDFISREEELNLLGHIAGLPFRQAKYKEYRANRRVVRFGDVAYLQQAGEFDEDPAENGNPRQPFPDFLEPLRERAAEWLGVAPIEFHHALVSEYQPGVPIGWHRDAPHFECIVGVTLAGSARMRFKPFGGEGRKDIFAIELVPRSAYIMSGPIRWNWMHSIPPHKALRYSITMRTLT